MEQTALIIATMDTKSEESLYLKDRLNFYNVSTVMMDVSMGDIYGSRADITPIQVLEAAGSNQEEMAKSKERSWMTQTATTGASRIAYDLYQDGKIQGVISIGGSTGSLMGTDVMRSLPFGIPKLMVSSTAALPGLSTRYIGTGDILLFHSVIEISSLSNMLKNVIDRAAAGLAGMLHNDPTPPKTENAKAIAMTMLGPCENCASSVHKALESQGYQVIGFSAAGISDRAMEDMITEGFFHGVVDLAPGGVGENLYGYMRDAGSKRMESAGKKGIPQVISTCSVNHMTPSKSKYKPEFYERRKYDLDKYRTWIRLTPNELIEVADVFAKKLNQAQGEVKVVIPLKGWSSVDVPGNVTYDADEDRVFIEELRKKVNNPKVQVMDIDYNMEDRGFSESLVNYALEIF